MGLRGVANSTNDQFLNIIKRISSFCHECAIHVRTSRVIDEYKRVTVSNETYREIVQLVNSGTDETKSSLFAPANSAFKHT